MDQGDAAVWAAGFGVFGTLTGALGGAFIQRRAALYQVRAQEAVDVRHRRRDERRAAFAGVLDRSRAADDSVIRYLEARIRDWESGALHIELLTPVASALDELQQAVTTVEITGPVNMAVLAADIHEALRRKRGSFLLPRPSFEAHVAEANDADQELARVRRLFVEGAHLALAPPAG